MISAEIKSFIEGIGHAFVASSDASGAPHLAAGESVSVPDSAHIVFEAWFCTTTLRNVHVNPPVAVVVAEPESGQGFQFIGRVEKTEETALLDGFIPGEEPAGMPQVQSRLSVVVERVMAFNTGAHTDQPLD